MKGGVARQRAAPPVHLEFESDPGKRKGRDLVVAFRLAVERPLPSGTTLFVVADDSNAVEPLCDLLPRLRPSIGDKARVLADPASAGAF